MKPCTTILIIIPLFAAGCANDDETGRGTLALSGAIPDAGSDGDIRWEVWDGDGVTTTLVLADAALESELLALSAVDLDGDGDLEVDCGVGDGRVLVDVGSGIDADYAAVIDVITRLEHDVDAWVDFDAIDELVARAEASVDLAGAIAGFDACALDPEPAIALCLASVELAADCSVVGEASCAGALAVDVSATACAAALTALTEGTVACVDMVTAQLQTLYDLERLGQLEELDALEEL